MVKLSKGQISRKRIIEQAREVFNSRGIQITMNELAKELGQGVSYITNHYRTKDLLFLALAEEYQQEYLELMGQQRIGEEPLTFPVLLAWISSIMDLQYKHRSAIVAIMATSNSQKELSVHISKSYDRDVQGLKHFLQGMVATGLLTRDILQQKQFHIFRFQVFTLLSTWVVSYAQYDGDKEYEAVKPIYLKGVMSCFLPFVSEEGEEQFNKLRYR